MLIVAGIILVIVTFLGYKLFKAGKTSAKVEQYEAQREVENNVHAAHAEQKKKSKEVLKNDKAKIDSGDFTSLNDN